MKTFVELSDSPRSEILPGFIARFVHSDAMTVSFVEIEKDAVLPEHHHLHEQISIVTDGELELTVDGETRILTPGTVAIIPSNVPHSARALTGCTVTDIFNPPRDDYRNK
jgi:quercetin dioxygenase-like cupin family protein